MLDFQGVMGDDLNIGRAMNTSDGGRFDTRSTDSDMCVLLTEFNSFDKTWS